MWVYLPFGVVIALLIARVLVTPKSGLGLLYFGFGATDKNTQEGEPQ